MTKFLRLGVVMAGAMVALGSLAACGDDSTASAPITSNPVTTTSMFPVSGAAGSNRPSVAAVDSESTTSSSSGTAAEGGSAGGDSTASQTASSGSQTLAGGAAVPAGETLTDKEKKYLAALHAADVKLLGDSDNSIALTVGRYVCDARRKNVDPATLKGYVVAFVGPSAHSAAEANTLADKVIKIAQENLC
ncbi:MAG: DUF732 domain-containing protein [Gordonia sp. (in: high G+C Gram-positive bacteria)]